MKRNFGNFLTRILWAGDTLSPIEYEVLVSAVSALPPPLRKIVEAQFDAYNLVQREIDGRELNFYYKENGKVTNKEGMPILNMDGDEAKLIRLTVALEGDSEPLHVILTAVRGRVFCLTLSRKIRMLGQTKAVHVLQIKQTWKSNVHLPEQIA